MLPNSTMSKQHVLLVICFGLLGFVHPAVLNQLFVPFGGSQQGILGPWGESGTVPSEQLWACSGRVTDRLIQA